MSPIAHDPTISHTANSTLMKRSARDLRSTDGGNRQDQRTDESIAVRSNSAATQQRRRDHEPDPDDAGDDERRWHADSPCRCRCEGAKRCSVSRRARVGAAAVYRVANPERAPEWLAGTYAVRHELRHRDDFIHRERNHDEHDRGRRETERAPTEAIRLAYRART